MAKKPVAKKEVKVKKIKVTGFAPLKFQDFTITQKSSGRFEVVNSKGLNVNGASKEKVLLDAKIHKPSLKKAVVAEETAAT